MLQVVHRKTINLDAGDMDHLAPYFDESSKERAMLQERWGPDELSSESAVLRALIFMGAEAIRGDLMEEGYRAWAASWDEEDEQWSKAAMHLAAEAWRDDEP